MCKKKPISVIVSLVMVLCITSAFSSTMVTAADDIIYTNDSFNFSITLPSTWKDKYQADEFENEYNCGVIFRSIRNYDAGAGGILFMITIYDEMQNDIPTEHYFLLVADGKYYYVEYAGDVESAYENPELLKEYSEMYNGIENALKTFKYIRPLPFNDVPRSAWYYSDVKTAFESGLISGKTATTFAPNSNLTYAEAVKLAACMHQRHQTGSVTLTNGSPVWYQSYVDYAKSNGIISKDYNWNEQATRAGYIEMFASALPENEFEVIVPIPDGDIPDVPMTHESAQAIYKLYRAGILQGVDDTHRCNPSANIKRSDVAAILTRMIDSSKRIRFSTT